MEIKPKTTGFTVLELIIVIAIFGILATLAVPLAQVSYIREQEDLMKLNMEDIRKAIDRWEYDCQAALSARWGDEGILNVPPYLLYPPDIGSLTKNEPYSVIWPGYNFTFYHGKYISAIPPDPFVGRAAWVQRFASTSPNYSITYDVGLLSEDIVGAISFCSGVFDISPIPTPVIRRYFTTAVDGTNYSDW